MLSDRDEIINELKNLQTDGVKIAEAKLQILSESGISFIMLLEGIACDRELDQYLKLTAASNLNSTIYRRIVDLPEQQISESLLRIMSNQSVSIVVKRAFERGIVTILEILDNTNLKNWQNMAIGMLSEGTSECLKFASFFIVNCMATADLEDQIFHRFIKRSFNPCLRAVMSVNAQNDYFLELAKEFCVAWGIVYDKLVQVISPECKAMLVFISKFDDLYMLFEVIYWYQSPENLIFCIHEKAMDINAFKFEVSEFHERILTFGCQFPKLSPANEHFSKLANVVIRTIGVVATHQNLMEQHYCEDLITQLFRMFNIYYKKNGQDMGEQLWVNLHEYIAYPFLIANENEREEFDQGDFQQFNRTLEDCCDKQILGVLKTQAAKLLEMIGDNFSASIEYAFQRAVDSLKVKLNFIQAPEKTDLRILQIESSLMVMTIFSYHISKLQSQQRIEDLRVILSDQRVLKMPPFQTSMLFFFLAYNFSEVFSIRKENFHKGQHLIDFALNYKIHATGEVAALDFLSNITDDFYDDGFTRLCAEKILNFRKHIVVFNTMNRLIENHYKKLSQQIWIVIIQATFARIQTEIKNIEEDNVKNTFWISNCLDFLTKVGRYTQQANDLQIMERCKRQGQIVSELEMMKVDFGKVKTQLWKITQFLDDAPKYDCSAELAHILWGFLKHEASISVQRTPYFFQILPKILNNFQQDEYMQNSHFFLINEYIMKSVMLPVGEQGQKSPLMSILRMLVTGLMFHSMSLSKKNHYSLQKNTVAHHLFLLQNFVAMHGNSLLTFKEDLFFQLGSLAMKFCPEDVQGEIIDKIVLARALNLIFLCHMHTYNDQALRELLKFHDLRIYEGYDSKMLMQCLNKQIQLEKEFVSIAEMVNIMVRVTKQAEEASLKVKLNGKTKPSKKSYSTKIILRKIEDQEKFLKSSSSPFSTSLQERHYLKQTLNMMSSSNPKGYNEIISKMTNQVREDLTQLVQPRATLNNGIQRPYLKIIGVKGDRLKQYQKNGYQEQDVKFKALKRTIQAVNFKNLEEEESEVEQEGTVEIKKRKVQRKKLQKMNE